MFTRLRFHRNEPYGMSTLELSGPHSELHLKFLSQLGKRERRAILRGLLVQLRPWLHQFTKMSLDHSRDGLIRTKRARERNLQPFQAHDLSTLSGSYGNQIRMTRLERGYSQTQLAQAVGIRRSHLSAIERGIHLPQNKTRQALEEALKSD